MTKEKAIEILNALNGGPYTTRRECYADAIEALAAVGAFGEGAIDRDDWKRGGAEYHKMGRLVSWEGPVKP